MITVRFTDDIENITATEHLYQWDVGKIINIKGLNVGSPKVHFTTKGDETALVVQSELVNGDINAVIPDKVLQSGKAVTAYIYLEAGVSKYTIKTITIPVIARVKPNDYVETNTQDVTVTQSYFEVMNERVNTLENVKASKEELAVERTRITALAKLGEGSTTGDAELADGRTDYTGKTWPNIGEHIRGVSSQLSGEIGESGTVVSLIIENESDGYIKWDTLAIEGSANWNYSKPIKVCAGYTYTFVSTNYNVASAVSESDKDGNLIRSVARGGDDTSKPQIISWEQNEDSYVVLSFSKVTTPTLKGICNLKKIMEDVDKNRADIKLFNGANILDGTIQMSAFADSVKSIFSEKYTDVTGDINTGYIGISGATGSSGYHSSVAVSNGDKLKLTSQYGYNMVMYVIKDINGNVVDYYPTELSSETIHEKNKVITVTHAGTLYVNSYADSILSVEKLIGFELGQTYYSPLWEKKAIFFGDSITANNGSWANEKTIRAKNKMAGENYGVGGSTYTVKSDSDSNSCIYLRVKKVRENANENDADYVIIAGGVNDAFQSLPIGSISDGFTSTLDESTFAGAFESTLRFILSNWVGKKIGFIANYKIENLINLGTYLDMAKSICKKYSVPCLDLYNESGYCVDLPAVKNVFTSDGTHINADGYKKLINDKVEAWMKTL